MEKKDKKTEEMIISDIERLGKDRISHPGGIGLNQGIEHIIGSNEMIVRDFIKIPFDGFKKQGYNNHQIAFLMVWWFEALEKALRSVDMNPKYFNISFLSKNCVHYSIEVDDSLLNDSYIILDAIPQMVVDNLKEKICLAIEKYDFESLGEEECDLDLEDG